MQQLRYGHGRIVDRCQRTGPVDQSQRSGDVGGPTDNISGSVGQHQELSFSPVPLNVKVAATITVTNNDGTDHTFTDNDGTFDTGHITPGASKTFTITKPGTYNYHCNIHPSMKGVIQVGA